MPTSGAMDGLPTLAIWAEIHPSFGGHPYFAYPPSGPALGSVSSSGVSSGRHTLQKSVPNGVRWMLRRTVREVWPERRMASIASGWASSTW
jgi:hypothetical protein